MNVHSMVIFNPQNITSNKKIRVRGISKTNHVATMFIFGNDGIFKYHNFSFFEECDVNFDNALIIKYEEDVLW